MATLPRSTRLIVAKAWSENIHDLGRMVNMCEIELVIMMIAIMLGELEDRPCDISSLAHTTGVPRATVKRKVSYLVTKQLIRIERDGVRKLLRPIFGENNIWDELMEFMFDRTTAICKALKKAEVTFASIVAGPLGLSILDTAMLA